MMKRISILIAILLGGYFLPQECFAQINTKTKDAGTKSITSSGEVRYHNKNSTRFELNRFDKMVSNGMRSEVSMPGIEMTDSIKEYSFSIFLPNDFATDTIPEIVAQWHARPDTELGETWRSPPISLSTKNGHWLLTVMWATEPVNTNKDFSGRKSIDLGVYKKNEWTSWKFEIRFSYKNDGLIKIYQNDRLVLDRNGPNYYNDKKGPFFKYGIYKFGWNTELNKNLKPKEQDSLRKMYTNPHYKGIHKRVLYFSDVKIGNAKGSYK
jgi:hypothetical protein